MIYAKRPHAVRSQRHSVTVNAAGVGMGEGVAAAFSCGMMRSLILPVPVPATRDAVCLYGASTGPRDNVNDIQVGRRHGELCFGTERLFDRYKRAGYPFSARNEKAETGIRYAESLYR